MHKYIKIAPDPDAKPCRCGDGNPDCEHFEFCPECGEEYKAHEGHDCLDGFAVAQVGTAKELRDAAKELRDSLDACETERDRLRSELDAAHDGEDALRSEVSRLRAQIAALQAVPQGVELTEDDVRRALMSNAIDVDVEGVTPRLNRIIVSRLAPTPPQAAPGAVVMRDPDDDDWDAFGFQQGTKAEVLRVWNRALATCKESLQVSHPIQPEERRVGPDDAVVSMDEWEALNAFLEDWRAPESRSLHDWNTSLKAKAARINALRTSAQAHNGEESK